jgi:RHH-type proline utilization regulon transcriptional repressor/proline dehydrogenase/delta 1-pyrroline-5-carboxylate dehydrogenase
VSAASRRAADRLNPVRDLGRDQAFSNEPDTDFSVATHRSLVTRALDALRSRPPFELCSVIGGARRATGDVVAGFDPSRPGAEPYRYHLARAAEVEAAIAVAESALEAPLRPSLSERIELVREVARALRRARPELIAVMLLDAGKRVSEADGEVSEAIDFAEYYLRQAEAVEREGRLAVRPRGITLVTSPWNFPLAIPLSGVLAALLAGNPVIFKPACETALCGERLAALLWEAGVPTDSLGLLLCRDELGTTLLRHPAVRAVVLTGATSTARYFLEQRPSMQLCAETGGKNPFIISRMADRELAIRDLVASAFGYAGQKCSAASLAILDAEVYDDRHFQSQLRDAAASLQVGSAWDPASFLTPLIRPPEEALRRGLTQLEPGESWLLEPREQPGNPRLWSPGIKLDVTAGSFTHQTELFGPVLGVLRARDFEHALELANATPYGLVAGLHSLDEREQARFIAHVAAGNLYVNRPITGAIVGRQPFGGLKASSVGPGAKAGGPNYVVQLQDWADALPPTVASAAPLPAQPGLTALASWAERELEPRELGRWLAYVSDYAQSVASYFRQDHAATEVLGQANVLRYLPCAELLLWATRETSVFDLACACAAAVLSGNRLQLSLTGSERADGLGRQLFELAALCHCPAQIESAEQLVARLASVERVRWLGRPPSEPAEMVLRGAARQGCYVSTRPVIGQGRYELLFNHREQAISLDYHRYGHLGWRSAGLDPSPALHGDDVR